MNFSQKRLRVRPFEGEGFLPYYFGFNQVPFTVLVGVVSFGIDIACALGVPDGFARVTKELDWIKNNGDEYVNTCSGRS
jgi:hypothetical protein